MFGKKENKAELGIQKVLERMQSFTITAGYSFEGRPIQKYNAPVCGETLAGAIVGTAAIPTNPGIPFSGALDKQAEGIDAARYAVLDQLLDKAESAGANALIGLAFQYVVVEKNGLLVMASATAVTI